MADESVRDLDFLEKDALREVASIGVGHAATALSQMVDRKTMVEVSQIEIVKFEDSVDLLGDPEERMVAVLLRMLGDATGNILIIFSEEDARYIADILLRREPGTTAEFGELEQSAIKETANILSGAQLSALNRLMGLLLLPSVPDMVIDMIAAILTTVCARGEVDEYVLWLKTKFWFSERERYITGYFLLLPTFDSIKVILNALHLKR